MSEAGKCTNTIDMCLAGTFCPASGTEEVACKSCASGTIAPGQGCNCTADIPTPNCAACGGNKCSQCLPGTYLSAAGLCPACDASCKTCQTDAAHCLTCQDGLVLENATCRMRCTAHKDCADINLGFCDAASGRCAPCFAGCLRCTSAAFCVACSGNGTNTVLTVDGQCTPKCANLAEGQYCRNGAPASCDVHSTSACKCGSAKNCAVCSGQNGGCGACLPHVLLDAAGACGACAEGYEAFGDLCVSAAGESPSPSDRLGGGAIAGIVIGVLAVTGAVGGGLAYYFTMRSKKYLLLK
ncbi:Cysteine-rich membrane protein 2 [Spironucleus salmonicida]|uniref:Cysteine-rich membrane protein 2 n=1 Tax=Spironucleus salmonicida TaxID=348837 RepID=V6LH06_9EUKA|nr:Cysteine-rich membrane protein 2 [Spironucleus salmonicida]KAH0570878.1 Cysteine-rich membrane protein 2 [Spironucleus salmonicida]|eukprot:EST43835.1 Cysteine-rich membrane protein 2 [Spironucleus salmonicida]